VSVSGFRWTTGPHRGKVTGRFALPGKKKRGSALTLATSRQGLWPCGCQLVAPTAQQTNGGGPESQRPQRAAGWDGTCSSDTGFFCSCSSKPGSVVALATSVPVRTRRNGLFRKPTPSSQQRLIQTSRSPASWHHRSSRDRPTSPARVPLLHSCRPHAPCMGCVHDAIPSLY